MTEPTLEADDSRRAGAPSNQADARVPVEHDDGDDQLHERSMAPADRSLRPQVSASMSISGKDVDFERSSLEFAQVSQVIDEYGLGRVLHARKLTRGFVNESFLVEVERAEGQSETVFLRKYRVGKKEQWVRLEHALLDHLEAEGFPVTPRIYVTPKGDTFVSRATLGGARRFFMVTSIVPGEDKYGTESNDLSRSEVTSAARIFGEFHSLASTLDHDLFVPGRSPLEARMLRKIGSRVSQTQSILEATADFQSTVWTSFKEAWPGVRETLLRVPQELPAGLYARLPHLPGHFDFHPGNLKYSGGEVCGMFDFDYCKVDARAFDVGLALVYFAAKNRFGSPDNGRIDLEQLSHFVRAYQEGTEIRPKGIGPLSVMEKAALPAMMQLGNAFLMYWFVKDYHALCKQNPTRAKEVEDDYTQGLSFRLGSVRWIEQQRTDIQQAIVRASS